MAYVLRLSIALEFLLGFAWPAFAQPFHFKNLHATTVPTYACVEALRAPGTISLGDEPEVVLVAWNVDNVLERRGKFAREGIDESSGLYQFAPPTVEPRHVSEWKFAAKQNQIARAARVMGLPPEAKPHFVIAPEVESAGAAEQLFNEGLLADQYRTFITHGNDARGIDIALAVRADLNVSVESETHRGARWWDSVERAFARVFTRDLPVWLIRDGSTHQLRLILIGQHAKSMRDRAGGRDPNSRTLRAAQFAATREIIKIYRDRFGVSVPILMAGDFNTDVRTAHEVRPLLVDSQLSEVFDHLNVTERITHTYHPAPGVVRPSQLDACLISDSVKPYLLRAAVLPDVDFKTGELLGAPSSLEDRQRNYPSDHRAIGVVLSGQMFR